MLLFELEKWFWTALAIYWIVAAFFVKKTVKREFGAARLIYIMTWAVACLLLFTDNIPLSFLYTPVLPQTFSWQIAGFLFCLSGLLFSVWARIYLGKNWSGNITIKENHELITTGPYALTRNPIYSGFLLAFFGCAMTSGLLKGYLSIPFVVSGILMKIAIEEKFMTEVFSEHYGSYRRKVKKLIPFLY
jgi:protein-S-isoprenylcysteine O-methyltransferase Ste14